MDLAPPQRATTGVGGHAGGVRPAGLRVILPTEAELALHQEYLAELERESKGRCVWLAADASEAAPS
jgi:hypothetical protein